MRKIEPKKYEGITNTPAKVSEKPVYPNFRIELVHLPEAKKWEIGDEYTVILKLKMTGISISRYQNDAEFDIHEIGIGENPKKKEE